MAESVAAHPNIHPSRIPSRWVQLAAGIIAMMAIANLQYAWTLFTKPIQAHMHVTLTAVQWTFALFIALETWLVPFEGYLVDRIGPRLMLGVGGILVGLGWLGAGNAESLRSLYFWYALGATRLERKRSSDQSPRAKLQRRHDALADGAYRVVLDDLRNDDPAGLRRTGGDGPTQSYGSLVSRGQGHHHLRVDGLGDGHRGGSHPERTHSAFLGMGIGSHRTGEHHVYRLQPGGAGGVCLAAADPSSSLVD